jgi:gamma-aminobutyric acid type B receptor
MIYQCVFYAMSLSPRSLFDPIQWLVSLGLSLIFSALFSKLWRINQVFAAAASMKRVVVTAKDVLQPFAILMTLNFVVLLSWTLVDPMVFERVYTDELTSYGRCTSQGNQWKGFIATLAILNFIALVLVNVQAYHARSINDELSESKYIGLATLSMFQIFLVGIPLLVLVYNDPSGKLIVGLRRSSSMFYSKTNGKIAHSVKTHFFSSPL